MRAPLLVIVFFFLAFPGPAWARKWTDASGKFSIEAEFIEVTADQRVRLRGKDGKELVIPLDMLSKPDRDFVAQPQEPNGSPFKVQSTGQNSGTKMAAKPSKDTYVVVAEGVGITSQKALKDAFRAAVRQAVGLVVDSETLVKNSELVEDKVLTYSDAFVPKHEVLSETEDDGLYRVRITATVERRSLVMKLRAANITVAKVEGRNLFSEITTQMQGEADAAALARKALADFPLNCLTAKLTGEPKIIRRGTDKSTIGVSVSTEVDQAAFRAFSLRLTTTLDRISKRKGDFSLTAKPWTQKGTGDRNKQLKGFSVKSSSYGLSALWTRTLRQEHPDTGGSRDENVDADSLAIAVNSSVTRSFDRSEWKYFVLDRSVLAEFAGAASSVMEVKVSLVDDNGDVIAVGRRVLVGTDWLGWEAIAPLAFDSLGYDMNFYSSNHPKSSGLWGPGYRAIARGKPGSRRRGTASPPRLGFVGPMFFTESMTSYFPALEQEFRFDLTADEIAQISSAKVELVFDGSLPPSDAERTAALSENP